MYKIAILGCENSHADNFLSLIKEGLYPDVEVIGVYSETLEAVQKLNEKYGVAILENYADAVGKVDGVMVTARHGDNHFKYAKPYLNDKIPMFIDKPITIKESDALEFMREAKKLGIRLCGGSTCAHLKETLELAEANEKGELGELAGGYISCPLKFGSPYGGFYFYASHLVEVMTAVFGRKISAINAVRTEDRVSFIANYGSFDVVANYANTHNYYVTLLGKGDGVAKASFLTFERTSFVHEMNDMLDLLRGGEMKLTYDEFILPVFIMNAIERSYTTGETVEISPEKV